MVFINNRHVNLRNCPKNLHMSSSSSSNCCSSSSKQTGKQQQQQSPKRSLFRSFTQKSMLITLFIGCFVLVQMVFLNKMNLWTTGLYPQQLHPSSIQRTGSWANCTRTSENTGTSTTITNMEKSRSSTQNNRHLLQTSNTKNDPTTKSTVVSCRTIPYQINLSNLKPSTQMIIGVLSSASSGASSSSSSSSSGRTRRQSIRDTWADTKQLHNETIHNAVHVFFLVAGPWTEDIQTEYETYGDLIWIDEEEVYDGEKSVLTYKTQSFVRIVYDAVTLLKESSEYTNMDVKYIFKTDDDSYIHVQNLYHQLIEKRHSDDDNHNHHQPPTDYWGWCQLKKFPPKRDTTAKWPISYELYPEPFYPRYCQGAGFALSWKFILCASSQGHIANVRFMPFEDASIGLVAERCGIVPTMVEKKRWINLYRTNSEEEKDRVRDGLAKIDKSKLTRPVMLNRIVQHRIYDEWDMLEHHKVVMDPRKYNKESKVVWYDPSNAATKDRNS